MKIKKTIFILLLLFVFQNIYSEDLTIWIMTNNWQSKESMDKILAPFCQESGLSVKVEVLDWGMAFNKVSEALISKDAPNIMQLGTTWTPYFAEKGYLSDLTKIYSEIDFERFSNSSIATCKYWGNDKYYGLPWFVDVRLIYCNKKYFDFLNINPNSIKTYKGFLGVLKKIKRKNKLINDIEVFPYGFPGKNDWNVAHNFAPWIWSEGGDFIEYKDGEWGASLLNINTIQGIYKYINIALSGYNMPKALKENSLVVMERFSRGEIAMQSNLTTLIKNLNLSVSEGGYHDSKIFEDGVYVSEFPSGTAGSFSFVGGSNLAVPVKFQNHKHTIELLKYLTSTETLKNYSEEIGFLSPDKNYWDKIKDKQHFNNIIKSAINGKAYPNISHWGDVEIELVNCFGEIWELIDGNNFSNDSFYSILLKYNELINNILNNNSSYNTISKKEFINLVQNYHKEINGLGFSFNLGFFLIILVILVSIVFITIIFIYIKHKSVLLDKIIAVLKKISRKSLVSSFALIIIVTQIIVISVISFVMMNSFIKEETIRTRQRNINTAENISMFIRGAINSFIDKLNLFSCLPAYTNLNKVEIIETINRENSIQLFIPGEKLFVLDINNNVIADNSYSKRHDFKSSIENFDISMLSPPEPYISNVEWNSTTPKINIAVSIEVRSKGAIVAEFSFRRLTEYIKKQKIAKNGFVLLADNNGKIVDYSNNSLFKEAVDLKDIGFKKGEIDYYYKQDINEINYNNNKYSVSYSSIPECNLYIVVMEQKSKTLQAFQNKFPYLFLIIFIVLLVTSIISFYIYTKIINPVNHLSGIFTDENRSKTLTDPKDIEFMNRKDEIGVLFTKYNSLIVELSKINLAYSRFVPVEFLYHLHKSSVTDINLGDQVQKEMTILFSDIRDFTFLSENMPPQENFNFINAILNRIGPLIRMNRGFIDKYIGDSIMALFPESPQDAVEAAILMQKTICEYNDERIKKHKIKIRVGIGIHTGNLMLGTIGEEKRMETTVISDNVNLASRLEGLTKYYGGSIIISEVVLNMLDNPERFNYRFLDFVKVRGKKKPLTIFEVFDGCEEKIKELKIKTKKDYEKGVQLFINKRYIESMELFNNVLKQNEDDLAAKHMISRCEHNLKYGEDDEFPVGLEMLLDN